MFSRFLKSHFSKIGIGPSPREKQLSTVAHVCNHSMCKEEARESGPQGSLEQGKKEALQENPL